MVKRNSMVVIMAKTNSILEIFNQFKSFLMQWKDTCSFVHSIILQSEQLLEEEILQVPMSYVDNIT